MKPSADSQIPELSRRHFLKSGASTLAAGAAAGIVTQEVANAQAAAANAAASDLGNYTKSGFPAANLGSVRDSVEKLSLSDELVCTTQQPVYVLPRDHKFHGGQFYATNHFWEWHYFSGFCKDAEGNEYALFFGTDPVGYDPKTGGYAFLPAVVSISPIKEGKNTIISTTSRYSNRDARMTPRRPRTFNTCCAMTRQAGPSMSVTTPTRNAGCSA